MLGAWKGFFASVCLVLSIQAVVAAADIGHIIEASVTIPSDNTLTSPAAVLNGPLVLASQASAVLASQAAVLARQAAAVSSSQASAVSANLRKKEEIEVDVEGV